MERLNVNPTRMMLTTLKKRLATAQRGHKLLKDKRDELMKGFLELARENKALREQVEKALADVYGSFSIAGAVMSKEVMEEALMFPKQGVALTVGSKIYKLIKSVTDTVRENPAASAAILIAVIGIIAFGAWNRQGCGSDVWRSPACCLQHFCA